MSFYNFYEAKQVKYKERSNKSIIFSRTFYIQLNLSQRPPAYKDNNNNSKFDIAHWSIDKSMFSGALWCAQEIKYQMQVQS